MFHELFSVLIPTAYAQAPQFVSLTNIPGLTNLTTTSSLPDLLRNLFLVTIGFAAILGVIMIAIGGAEYMLSDKVSSISKGKARMQNALIGLGIILGSYLILYTINPDLLKINVLLPPAISQGAGGSNGIVLFTVSSAQFVADSNNNYQNMCDRAGGVFSFSNGSYTCMK